jgi:hypothetical protein
MIDCGRTRTRTAGSFVPQRFEHRGVIDWHHLRVPWICG